MAVAEEHQVALPAGDDCCGTILELWSISYVVRGSLMPTLGIGGDH